MLKKLIIKIILALAVFSNAAYAAELSDWARADYMSANSMGLIPLSVAAGRAQDNVTRSEFCNLAMNLYDTLYSGDIQWYENPFSDCYHDFITKAYSLGIVSGKTETEFCPDESVTRQEMARILVKTIETAGRELSIENNGSERAYQYADFSEVSDWAKDSFVKAIQYGLMSGVSDTDIAPNQNATREQAVAIINRSESLLGNIKSTYDKPALINLNSGAEISGDDFTVRWHDNGNPGEYAVLVKDDADICVDIGVSVEKNAGISTENFEDGHTYSIIIAAVYPQNKAVFSDPVYVRYKMEEPVEVEPVESVFSPYVDKKSRVFPSGQPFASKEEADANMKTVYVPVWQLQKDGSKKAGKLELAVNVNLADEVVQIFNEIFNDPEQFPIKNVGGYSWRMSAVGKLSEHSYGTCIDINYDENYYCYAETGEAITGSFWLPGLNPYSIPENGSVVRTFAKYGWSWGGNAWTRLRDYMHFTYLGN